jgi:hypothetical protein
MGWQIIQVGTRACYVPQGERVRFRNGFGGNAAITSGLLRVRNEVIRRKMRVTPIWNDRKIIC